MQKVDYHGLLSPAIWGIAEKEMPEIDGLLGTFSWDQVVELLDALEQKETQRSPLFYKDVKSLMYEGAMPRMRTGPSFSAYFKVAKDVAMAALIV